MDIWEELYNRAKEQYGPREVSPFLYAHHVVAAVEAENGEIYTGFCMEALCGTMELCAERTAALNMYLQSGQTKIKRLLAFRDRPPYGGGSGMPCGSCREFLMELNYENRFMEILLDYETREVITLKELMPYWWGEERFESVEGLIRTDRLFLRPWQESDAGSLFQYAKDPEIGPIAGWLPHKSREQSLEIIKGILAVPETYAVCRKEDNKAIGSISLKFGKDTDLTDREGECELGFWIGRSFWGNGYIPEAVNALLAYGFEELHLQKVWCGYYDGNIKSKRVQEKCGFVYHHTTERVEVPMLEEYRIGHVNVMTREQWKSRVCQIERMEE